MPASIVAICLFFEREVQVAVALEKRSFTKPDSSDNGYN